MKKPSKSYQIPKRFRVTKSTLWFDHFMNYFIVVGGAAVIAAVMGIFVFIFFQVLPLFQDAKVEAAAQYQLTENMDSVVAVDMDEWGELPLVLHQDGSVEYLDLKGDRGTITTESVFPSGETISTLNYSSINRLAAAGSEDGKFAFATLGYRSEFDQNSERTIYPQVDKSDWYQLGEPGETIRFIDYGAGDNNKMAVGICIGEDGQQHVRAITLKQRRSLFGGGGQITVGDRYDLTQDISAEIQDLDVSANGQLVIVSATSGEVFLFVYEGGELNLRQRFWPFDDVDDKRIGNAEFLLGDISVVFTGIEGQNRLLSLSLDDAAGKRLFSQTKEFETLPESPEHFFPGV